MGHVMKLSDAIINVFELDDDATVYAVEPWGPDSEVALVRHPGTEGVPELVVEAGMTYFLEVHIVQQFLEDWITPLREKPTLPAIVQRVIDYAINDA